MKPNGAKRITIVPVTLPSANAVVERLHRHHGKMPGGFAWWALAAIVEGRVVGVALAGRPTNRNNDDGQTVEVLRTATDGTINAPSALLGACARCAEASGASLRGAGWVRETDGITSWWTHAGTRTPAITREHHSEGKVRWAKHFRKAIELPPELQRPASAQAMLGEATERT